MDTCHQPSVDARCIYDPVHGRARGIHRRQPKRRVRRRRDPARHRRGLVMDAEITDPAEFWDHRYLALRGDAGRMWSGRVNATVETEVAGLQPGTALELGCGEGADARERRQSGRRWHAGAEFKATGGSTAFGQHAN